jgi:regulator of protease activity HflC (stomatin/prohibitin superfamily)
VTDTQNAVYGVEDYREAVINIISTSLRAIVGAMDLDEALSSRDHIKARLRESLSDDVADWGVTLKSVEIQDIKPSPAMQEAMEKQAAAERERKAMVTKAEGEKRSMILNAEGKLEASRLEATANVALAEGAAEAIRKVTQAIGEHQFPAYYLLGEKYISALRDLAVSPNGKTILLPADLMQTVQGMLGKKG